MSELYFKTNAQLKSIIGRDLINDDNIAVLELVKNSFDANAKRVDVIFKNLKENDDCDLKSEYTKETTRIIIRDDGVGMDLDDIENKWLNIAYSEKKEKTEQHHRRMAGAKGVGRFSCDRLGQYLRMYAKTENSDCVLLKVDWSKFEIDEIDKEIQSVPVVYEKISQSELDLSGYKNFKHGVILEIIKLRSVWAEDTTIENWNVDKLLELKRNLEKLINPSQAFIKDDFDIYLQADEFVKENEIIKQKRIDEFGVEESFLGKIENKIFQKLNFRTTSIECETEKNGTILKTTLMDKGEAIYWIKEKSDFYNQLKNVKITLYYLNPYAKAFFTKQTGIRSVNYGSIFVFLNGFRIPPYGDYGNDWLGLDQRRTQGYARFLGTRDLLGQIEIVDDDGDFKIISSREGLVNNDSYDRLTARDGLFYSIFKRLERYVVDGLKWDSIAMQTAEVEKLVLDGKLKENDVQYAESDKDKRDRIYANIMTLIKPNTDNVIELYINENLIGDKLNEKKEEYKQEYDQLVDDLRNNRLSKDMLAKAIEQLSQEGEVVDKQLSLFSKYNTTDETTKALEDMQSYKDDIEKYVKMIVEMQGRLDEQVKQVYQKQQDIEELKQQKQKAEQKAAAAEVKQQKAEHERDITKQKNRYLEATRTLSDEDEALIHAINIYGVETELAFNKLSDSIVEGTVPREVVKEISVLKTFFDKIKKIASLLSKANIIELAEPKIMNLSDYIVQYINSCKEIYPNITFEVVNQNKACYMSTFSMLDVSVVLDNLISNSKKAKANEILITIKEENNTYIVDFSDSGIGIPDSLLQDNGLFEKGVTTCVGGSGIGLASVYKILKDMEGKIYPLGNHKYLKGATFRIEFKKYNK